jgi:hypothetical protein
MMNSCRFRREEAKIHTWENHQKEKINAEMKRVEVAIPIYAPTYFSTFYFRPIYAVL